MNTCHRYTQYKTMLTYKTTSLHFPFLFFLRFQICNKTLFTQFILTIVTFYFFFLIRFMTCNIWNIAHYIHSFFLDICILVVCLLSSSTRNLERSSANSFFIIIINLSNPSVHLVLSHHDHHEEILGNAYQKIEHLTPTQPQAPLRGLLLEVSLNYTLTRHQYVLTQRKMKTTNM